MKVYEIPYKRYTIEEGRAAFGAFKASCESAKCADDVIRAREAFLAEMKNYEEAASLSNCRFTLDTRDEFYQAEMGYYDENGPLFSELFTAYADLMLSSPFRAELESKLGSRRFKFFEIAKKSFSPEIIDDMQKENAVVTEYSKFMSELVFDYDGEKMPLAVLRGKLSDSDREVRKKAAYAVGKGLEGAEAQLDDIYDRLVKIRDTMAKKLGFENFIELGYYRMNRVDYNAEMVATFRENVKKYIVPCVTELKKSIAEELGIDTLMFYDDPIYVKGEVPRPKLNNDEIFVEAQKMYDEMSEHLGSFMRSMVENEAFDVLSRDGKWGGGYCTCFPKEEQPFILANFNGTSGDVDVITHEFGHAFAAKNVFTYGDEELGVGGMETAECHSMSMEFLCHKGMDRFFSEPDKYRYSHLCGALSFIPYGVIVDEFQHIAYEHPEYTPEERKAAYRELEKKYRPYLSFEGIPYLEKGTRWQYQMHIYETPFYYIDYCLAQTVALSFFKKSKEDYEGALKSYIEFARKGGTKPFGELLADADIPSPFADGSLEGVAKKAIETAEKLKKSF